MADELLPQEAEPTPAVAPEAEQQEEPDYKALWAAEKARAEKAESDHRAAVGRQKAQNERDEILYGIAARQEATDKSIAALIKAMADGDTDELPTTLTKIQNDAYSAQAQQKFEARYAKLFEELETSVLDEEGKPLVDIRTSPLWEDVRQEWVAAYNARDLGGLTASLSKSLTKARHLERKILKELASKAKAEAKASAKAKLDEAGVLDLDTGSGASGAGDEKLTPTQRIQRGLEKRVKQNK